MYAGSVVFQSDIFKLFLLCINLSRKVLRTWGYKIYRLGCDRLT